MDIIQNKLNEQYSNVEVLARSSRKMDFNANEWIARTLNTELDTLDAMDLDESILFEHLGDYKIPAEHFLLRRFLRSLGFKTRFNSVASWANDWEINKPSIVFIINEPPNYFYITIVKTSVEVSPHYDHNSPCLCLDMCDPDFFEKLAELLENYRDFQYA